MCKYQTTFIPITGYVGQWDRMQCFLPEVKSKVLTWTPCRAVVYTNQYVLISYKHTISAYHCSKLGAIIFYIKHHLPSSVTQ